MQACSRAMKMQTACSAPARGLRLRCRAQRPAAASGRVAAPGADGHGPLQRGAAAALASVFALCLAGSPLDAQAAQRTKQPPVTEEAGRCEVAALDKFADTRATFSQEASGGNMSEAVVDIRDCDFAGKDLSGKVFSGVLMRGANLSGGKVVGSQFARADAQGANLDGLDLTDVNAYSTAFDGASLRNAQFENAVLTAATFGKSPVTGEWADLAGAHFEGALLSSSDVARLCENPTLDPDVRAYELGCKKK
ncbi:MAG: hypothetical protein J3K34DRAFT_429284 [Monoraphidium minutum]|nr:MAG: hypothetical protein J3K34DRAFT_429284 [Monoraphidium minutum]